MEAPVTKSLNDVGTRYEHERQLISDLEDAVEVYQRKIAAQGVFKNRVDINALIKFGTALEVLHNLLLARSRTNDLDVAYGFRNMIEDAHKDRTALAGMVPLKDESLKEGNAAS